jgi:sucrose synthase
VRGLIQSVLDSHEKIELQQFVKILSASQKRYLLRNEILHEFTEYCVQSQKPAYFYHSSLLGELIHYTHEILLEEEGIWFVVRARLASQEVWQLAPDCSEAALMPPQALLQARDRQVNRARPHILELNFRPFSQDTPSINDARNIGQGLTFLNRHLCDRLLSDPDYWQETLFDVLHRHEFNGIPLLIGDRIESASQLHQQVVKAKCR